MEFYPSRINKILDDTMTFAKNYTQISEKDFRIKNIQKIFFIPWESRREFFWYQYGSCWLVQNSVILLVFIFCQY